MVLFIFVVVQNSTSAISFKDLSHSHWAYKNIISLANDKIINGYENGTFMPNGTITNAEFIKLVVVAGLPKFIDMNDAESNMEHWAGKYIWIAERYGIIKSGAITLYNINNPITRIEMVRIISRADMLIKGNNLNTKNKLPFRDVISLNNEDLLLLKHAYSKGLVNGYTDNTFMPYSNMNRAEAATMIYRFTKQ